MKNIQLNQNRKPRKHECLVCGEAKADVGLFEPCKQCRKHYLEHGVLLIEVIKDIPTGHVMIIRDIAFEHVFNQEIPKEHVIKVEVGILQRMEEHIANAE